MKARVAQEESRPVFDCCDVSARFKWIVSAMILVLMVFCFSSDGMWRDWTPLSIADASAQDALVIHLATLAGRRNTL